MSLSAWWIRSDLGGEELAQGGTWVQEHAGQSLDSEGETANGF